MATAILISGQLRTFAQCWPTQRWHVLRHFADPHFFITVQFDQAEIIADLITEYGQDRVHYDPRVDPDLSAYLTPELSRAYHAAPYANAAPAHQLLLQHWYQAQCWANFSSVSSKLPAISFDTIIRMRADLWFHSFEDPLYQLTCRFAPEYAERGIGGIMAVRRVPHDHECFTPWWGRFGGINDRFAVMGCRAASYYFNTWDHIPELLAAGCPFHPESLVRANLERGDVDLRETLRTEFSTFRADGNHRPPEIAPWDIAHASLR